MRGQYIFLNSREFDGWLFVFVHVFDEFAWDIQEYFPTIIILYHTGYNYVFCVSCTQFFLFMWVMHLQFLKNIGWKCNQIQTSLLYLISFIISNKVIMFSVMLVCLSFCLFVCQPHYS